MIINFVSASVSRTSMGIFEVSRQLALNLIKERNQVNVFGLQDSFTKEDNILWSPIKPRSFSAQYSELVGYSKEYLRALLSTQADIAHLHVIWKYQSAMIYKWHKKYRKPYVTSVNGMLEPWIVNKSPYKKGIARILYENKAQRNCSCFHVNTISEYNSLRNLGLKNPISIINNGVSIPDLSISYNKPPWQNLLPKEKKILLFLSRVHPKKGLVNLVEAIEILKRQKNKDIENWMLVIVGCKRGGEHEQELIKLVAEKKLGKYVLFLGEYFNEDMKACYFNCDAFILPSYSEGVPIAALNAWAFGKYSLLTPECNLTEGYSKGISQRIETNPDSIASNLISLFSKTKSELKIIGDNAHDFAKKEYSWTKMAKKMSEVYRWVSTGGVLPDHVTLN